METRKANVVTMVFLFGPHGEERGAARASRTIATGRGAAADSILRDARKSALLRMRLIVVGQLTSLIVRSAGAAAHNSILMVRSAGAAARLEP